MKEKKVLNGEQIRRKEEKKFSLGLIIGLGLFIALMLILNNNFNEAIPFSLNKDIIKTVDIFKKHDDQGKEYQKLYSSYEVFVNEIDSFNLDELVSEDFKDEKEYYSYKDENYSYIAGSNYIKLIKDGKDLYYNVIEKDAQNIILYSDITYELEIKEEMISFKVGDYKYEVINDNSSHTLKTNYLNRSYNVIEEIYDEDYNFTNLKVNNGKDNYVGYFIKDLEGYYLSEDESNICKDDECKLSTKYLEDGETIYYTLVDYFFSEVYSIDMLLVKEGYNLPF